MHLKKEHRINNICDYCDRSFKQEKELEKQFKNINTEEMECSDCNKKFGKMRVLKLHFRKEHGIKEIEEEDEAETTSKEDKDKEEK